MHPREDNYHSLVPERFRSYVVINRSAHTVMSPRVGRVSTRLCTWYQVCHLRTEGCIVYIPR